MSRFVIIGNGVAGLSGALGIRDRDPDADVVLVADEEHPTYFRAGLSEWMRGELGDEELAVRPEQLYDRLRIEVVQSRAERLDLKERRVELAAGEPLRYDKLLVATGASPFVPPWPGRDLEGILTYRSWDDCVRIRRAINAAPGKPAVIVGGGILGMEFAYDCQGLDVQAILLVRESRVGEPIFDDGAAAQIERRLRAGGVTVRLEEQVERFDGVDGKLTAVVTDQGQRIECGVVVVAVGVRPNVGLFDRTGIAVNRFVDVDRQLRTTRPDVYAAGDVAQVFDAPLGRHVPTRTWEPSYWQGRIAGRNMAGASESFHPGGGMNASLVYDLPYVLLGQFNADGEEVEPLVAESSRGSYAYRKLLFERGVLIGGTFLEDRRQFLAYRRLMDLRIDLTEARDRLLRDDLDVNLLLPSGELDYYFF